jgi:hypothetical protein
MNQELNDKSRHKTVINITISKGKPYEPPSDSHYCQDFYDKALLVLFMPKQRDIPN